MWVAAVLRPRSLRSLILGGFALALAPLAGALGVAIIYVDRLAEQSQVAVVQAVEATQGSRLMISQIIAMERNVRQYLLLGNPELMNAYQDTHGDWRRTLDDLSDLHLDESQRVTLKGLGQAEQALFDVFGTPSARPLTGEQPIVDFQKLQELARDFQARSSEWVDQEVESLRALAGNATLMLSWLTVAVVPAVMVVSGGFTAMILRPLRHIARAIIRLGKEDFLTPVVVTGPRDLENVSKRLDWLRQRLAELEEQKARFLRHMSHELKTPLTDLREGTELLADQVLGPLNQDQQEVASILRENSLRLQRLIEDLLNFNQALSRTSTLRMDSIDLKAVVKEVIDAQQLAWKSRDLKISADLQPIRLIGDREKLATVVDNLLSNAIKYSPPETTIRLDLRKCGDVARLTVQDCGPGFPPDERKQVFDAFFQGRMVAKGHVKGSGLGLAIAREYATAHNGSLDIVDLRILGGCICLTLPIKQEIHDASSTN
jgi:two-component system sensor histidine kinase GlrK